MAVGPVATNSNCNSRSFGYAKPVQLSPAQPSPAKPAKKRDRLVAYVAAFPATTVFPWRNPSSPQLTGQQLWLYSRNECRTVASSSISKAGRLRPKYYEGCYIAVPSGLSDTLRPSENFLAWFSPLR